MNRRRNNIRELATRIVALQAKARALGLFTNDRELIEATVEATGDRVTH